VCNGVGDRKFGSYPFNCNGYSSKVLIMLELIGFVALAYLAFKFLPAVLEAGFKFAIICIGLLAFILLIGFFTTSIQIAFSG